MFASAVAQVAVASASPDDRNHAYAGIRMEIEPDGHLTLAATDRYRGRTRAGVEPAGDRRSLAVTVPGRELLEATKAFADAGEVSVHLGDSETSISLTAKKTRQTGLRLMDSAGFPKFRSLLPTQFVSQPRSRSPPSGGAQAGQLGSAPGLRGATGLSADEVVLRAGTGDEATATETLGCVAGEGLDVAFNPRFLADGLAG